jgi:hypothetical protein
MRWRFAIWKPRDMSFTDDTYSEVWSESEARWVPETAIPRIARINAAVAAEEMVAEHDVHWLLEIATASLAGIAAGPHHV